MAIAAGYRHSLALKSDGSIIGWGYNSGGVATPPGGNNFVAIAAGESHSLALKSDGTIISWGDNTYGQTKPLTGNDFVAVEARYEYSLALKSNGSIVCWGNNDSGCATPPTGNNYVAIAAGWWRHSLALKSNGSIVGWGNNDYGQATPPDGNNFVAIAAGGSHSLALKADGSIAGWGYNGDGECNVPAPNTGFVAIAAGNMHSLGLKSDGSIVAWGYNSGGQCDVPEPNADFVAIAAGSYHSLGLKVDGTIVGWGSDAFGETIPPAGNDFVAIAAGGWYSLGLKSDGNIVGWGWNDYGQATPPDGNNFVAITAGYKHSLAMRGGELPLAFKIRYIRPTHAGNLSSAIVEIIGSGFKKGAGAKLIQGSTELEPNDVSLVSTWKLKTRFDLIAAPPGKYDIVVTNPGGHSITLPESFEIVEGGQPQLYAKLIVPPRVRPGRSYTACIEYGNDGDMNLPVPILELRNSAGVEMQIDKEGIASQTQLLLLGIPTSNDHQDLLPGERETIPVVFTAPARGGVNFSLSAYQPDDTPFDWDAAGEALRPQFADPQEWNSEWRNLTTGMGTTWRQVVDETMIWQKNMSFPEKFGFDFLSSLAYAAWMRLTLPCEQTGVFNPEQDVQVVPVQQVSNPTHTFIITHGWNTNPNDPSDKVYQLAEAIAASCPKANVIKVDWQKGACTGWDVREASGNIPAAGEAAYQKLLTLLGQDFCPEHFVYVGHSFGNGVNQVIDSQAKGESRAVILSPPNNKWGGWPADYTNSFKGGNVAIISRSLGDNGPCFFKAGRIADTQILVDSSIGPAGHGKSLDCFTNQVPSNPSDENCSWIESFFTEAQNLQKGPAGDYDAKMNNDCSGMDTNQPFSACGTTNELTILARQVASALAMVIHPVDPSEKRGNEGYDPCGTPPELCQHFVRPGEPFVYTVFFENDPNATAPAQEVRIVDYLSPSLNWATVELGEIAFGDQVVTTLAGKVSGQDTVPLNNSPYVVDINAQFNPYTGRLSWTLRTIDPNTGDLPEDPCAGFLPPDDANHRGEGHVTFSISPQQDLLDARIYNKATIFFDIEPPFDVNAWLNVIDGSPPESAVLPLPPLTIPKRFEVQWTGDDGQGCGIDGYDLYVATQSGPYVPWLVDTNETSAVFAGVPGYTYRFYCVAHDSLGNTEVPPPLPDAQTTLSPVNLRFYAKFAAYWLESDCQPPWWCEGMDLNTSQAIDLDDLAILAANWLLDCNVDPNNPSCIAK